MASKPTSTYMSTAASSYNPTPIDPGAVILVTAGYDHTVRFWEALSGVCIRTIQHPDSQVNRLVVSADKRYIAVAGAAHIKLFEVQTANPSAISTFDGHKGNVTALAIQATNRWMVSGGDDGTIKVWDLRTSALQRDYDHQSPVTDVIIHPNQGELVSCDQNGSIKIWDLSNNVCTHELVPAEDTPMRALSMAADASLLLAGNDAGHVYIWRTATKGSRLDLLPLTRLDAHTPKYLLRLALSPDNSLLATSGSDGLIKIWKVSAAGSDWEMLRALQGHGRWVWDLAWSADSAYLLSASSDCSARLWDVATGDTIRQYTGHQKAVLCVALNDLNLAS